MLVRALIPDPAAIRTGRAMSMPRLDSRCPPATGVPSASGTVMLGACAACASASDQVAAVSVSRPADSATTSVNSKTPANGIGQKRKAACAGSGLKLQRKRRLTPSRHRGHDRLLGKDSLVITGQLFVSLRQ